MKFRIKQSPHIGDKRTVIKFAWLPVKAMGPDGEYYYVWLDKYHQKQVFTYNSQWVWEGTDNWIF